MKRCYLLAIAAIFASPAYATNVPVACNGLTNNAQIIQAALNNVANPAVTLVGMGNGDCFTGPLVIHSFNQIDLSGVPNLKLANGANDAMFTTEGFSGLTGQGTDGGPSSGSGIGPYRFSIRNGILDGNKANNTGTAPLIQIYGYDYELRNLKIQNSQADGIYSEWQYSPESPTGGMEATFDNVVTAYNNGWGTTFYGPHDSKFLNVTGYHNNQNGGQNGCFQNDFGGGSIQVTNAHCWSASEYVQFSFRGGVAFGWGLYAEGAYHTQMYAGNKASTFIIGFLGINCTQGASSVEVADGAQLTIRSGGLPCGIIFDGNQSGVTLGDAGL
jgi:hypothetical protein